MLFKPSPNSINTPAMAARPSIALKIQAKAALHGHHNGSKLVGTWLAGTVVSIALVTAPAKADDLSAGQEVFNNTCAACHNGGFNVVDPEKTLRRAALEQYLDGGFKLEAIVHQVENGKGAMPAWAGRLSEDEIRSVAAYVYDQASGDKW